MTIVTRSGYVELDKKLADFTEPEMDQLLYGKPKKIEMQLGGKAVTVSRSKN